MTNLFIQIFNVILKFTSDYGIAVILFTLLVKLVLLPFTIKQRKSMKIQQKLTEKMNLLKEKYKDDKDKLNQEMVNLYKENPGCSFSFLLLILQLIKTRPLLHTSYFVCGKPSASKFISLFRHNKKFSYSKTITNDNIPSYSYCIISFDKVTCSIRYLFYSIKYSI